MKHFRGFTLIELMVTLLILAIIAAMAAPSFNGVIRTTRIDSNLSKIRTAMNFARAEAASKGLPVSICVAADDTLLACHATSVEWSDGWIVFNDLNRDGVIDGDDLILRVWEGVSEGTTMTGVDNAGAGVVVPSFVNFDDDGTRTNTVSVLLDMTVPNCGDDEKRLIEVQPVGRVLITSSDC